MKKQIPATWKFGLLAIGAVAVASVAFGAAPAHATDVPACVEADIAVAETGTGTGVYTASISSLAVAECGVWLQTFSFDNDYVPVDASDYGHPQTAVEWAWVVLTPIPQKLTAVVPACGPYQTDVSVGELQLTLPAGDLGTDWVAGSVGVRPLCEVVVPPAEVPTTPAPETPTPEPLPEAVVAIAPIEDTRALAASDSVAAKAAPDELAATGFEPWILAPAAFLIVAGSTFLVFSRRSHQ